MVEKDKEGLQTRIIQMEYLNQQIRAMEVHLSDVGKAIDELSVLKVGLRNMSGAKKGDELLVPLGASSYVAGELLSPDRVMVSVGAGVFVEKKVEEAAELVEKQVGELKEQEELVIQNISVLNQEADRLSGELNEALKAGQNV